MLRRTVFGQGWPNASAQGWLERVRRGKPPPPPGAFEALTENKSLVPTRGDLVALLHVGRKADRYGMKTRGLPGTLAPRYHELQVGKSDASATSLTWLTQVSSAASSASMRARLARLHVRDAVADPVHVLLDRRHHVREHRRAAGAGDDEQVREAGHAEAEIGSSALPPTSPPASTRRVPRMSILITAPVMASKPVANTIASTS